MPDKKNENPISIGEVKQVSPIASFTVDRQVESAVDISTNEVAKDDIGYLHSVLC